MEEICDDGGNTCLAHGGSLYETASDETNLRDQVSHNSFCNCFRWRNSPLLFRMERELYFCILLGTQFVAGFFLGMAWMNFISDSARTFGDLTDKTYPFAFMLCTAGYFITILADIILAWVYERYDGPSIRSAISHERMVGE